MKIVSTGPVVLFADQGEYIHVMYAFTPLALRGQGLMRKLWLEEILPSLEKNLLLALKPDLDTDPVRLRGFYEELGFEFDDAGLMAVLCAEDIKTPPSATVADSAKVNSDDAGRVGASETTRLQQ